jgi:hypothetical protein
MKITKSQLKQLIKEELTRKVGVPMASMEESGEYELVTNPVGRPKPEQEALMTVDDTITLELHTTVEMWYARPRGTITPSRTLTELIEKMNRFGPEQRFADSERYGSVLRGDDPPRDTAIGLLERYRESMLHMLS